MLQDWVNKLSVLIIVVIAFVDGILVANQWKETSPNSTASEVLILEDILEQKNSSSLIEETLFQAPPFTTQAPYGIWDTPWAYFAEEACSLMASAWASEENPEDPAALLLKLRNWGNNNLGTFKDTDLDQSLLILKEFFNLIA